MSPDLGPSGEGGLRELIREVLNEDGRREKVRELVDSAFELRSLVDVQCPECRRKLRAVVPDVKAQVGALTALLAEAEGKPGTSDLAEAGLTLVVERSWPVAGVADRN